MWIYSWRTWRTICGENDFIKSVTEGNDFDSEVIDGLEVKEIATTLVSQETLSLIQER